MRKSNAWLLLAIPFLPVAAFYCASALRVHDPSTITSTLGVFPTQTAKQRAAILRLSQDLQGHPKANVFVIEDDAANTFMEYTREGKDNEVFIGPNRSILLYTYTKLGLKYGMNPLRFQSKPFTKRRKLTGI